MIRYVYPATCNYCGMQSGSDHGQIVLGAVPANQSNRYICPDCVRKIVESEAEFWLS